MTPGAVGHTGKSGKLRTGRTPRHRNAIRINTVFRRMSPYPTYCRLNIMQACGIDSFRNQPVLYGYCHIAVFSNLLRHRHLQTLVTGIPSATVDHQQSRINLFIIRTENIHMEITAAVRSLREGRINHIAILPDAGWQFRQGKDCLRMVFPDFFIGGICRKRCVTRNFRSLAPSDKR